jgi:hypothetical protein
LLSNSTNDSLTFTTPGEGTGLKKFSNHLNFSVMKHMKAGVVAMTLILASCSTDTLEQADNKKNTSAKAPSPAAANAVAPTSRYAFISSAYREILKEFQNRTFYPGAPESIAGHLRQTAMENPAFLALSPSGYPEIQPDVIARLNDTALTDWQAALEATSLTTEVKTKLGELISNLIALKGQEATYGEASGYTQEFDQSLAGDSGLSGAEKQTILITTEVTRTAWDVETDGKEKDRDWELSVGNIIGTAVGADEGPAAAITARLILALN